MRSGTPSSRRAMHQDGTVRDVADLLPGDEIQATDYTVRYRGVVEETAPAHAVVWIRESRSGHRRMLDTVGFSIRLAEPWDTAGGSQPGDGTE